MSRSLVDVSKVYKTKSSVGKFFIKDSVLNFIIVFPYEETKIKLTSVSSCVKLFYIILGIKIFFKVKWS